MNPQTRIPQVPPLDGSLSPPFTVAGHSHFPQFHIGNADFNGVDPEGAYLYRVSLGDLLTLSGGTLSGSAVVSASGNLTWTGGTMSGTGTTSVAGLASAIDDTAGLVILGRVLANTGTITFNSADANFGILFGADVLTPGVLNNADTFNVTAGGDFYESFSNPGHAINNSGTWNVSGAGTTSSVGNGIAFNNTGVVDVQSGILQLNGGGTHTGDFSGAGAIQFGGTHNLNAGAEVTTSELQIITSGTVILHANEQIANTTNVTIDSVGLLDLQTFATSETIANLSGSGTVDLGTGSVLTAGSAGNSIFSGVIDGTGGITKAAAGKLTLTGVNPFTGPTVAAGGILEIGGPGGALTDTSAVMLKTGGTLLLSGDPANKINDLAAFTLNDGTLNTGGIAGLDEQVGTLTLSANSTLDLGVASGSTTFRFADSSAEIWNGTLKIYNWTGTIQTGGGPDQLFFGDGMTTGLLQSQLNAIRFYSDAGNTFLGTAGFATMPAMNGEIVPTPVPEPSVVVAALGILGIIGWRERRRTFRGRLLYFNDCGSMWEPCARS